MAAKIPRTPSGLSTRGRAFWKNANQEFDFSHVNLAVLLEICRCIDRLDALDQSIQETGPMTTGSQGQPVVNPALTEARGQQVVLHRLISSLQLEDEDGEIIHSAGQVSATFAANARWQKRRDA